MAPRAAIKPRQVNEHMWAFGDSVRVERGPVPGAVEALRLARTEGRDEELEMQYYVYQLVDDDPTDSQDGAWEEVGTYKKEETAFAKAAEIA